MYIFYYCSFTGAPSVLGSALALASESSRMHACNKTTERHGRTYKLHAHPWAVALTHLISQSTLASLTDALCSVFVGRLQLQAGCIDRSASLFVCCIFCAGSSLSWWCMEGEAGQVRASEVVQFPSTAVLELGPCSNFVYLW